MNKIKVFSISLAFPYDIMPTNSGFRAMVAGLNHMSAEGETEYLAKEELRFAVKQYIQSAINKQIPLPPFIEVR